MHIRVIIKNISCVLFLTVSLVLLLQMISCSKDSKPEDIVKKFISLCEEAVKDRNGRSLRGLISDRYHDQQGRTKQDLSPIISGYILRNRSIHIFSRLESISSPSPDQINATILVAMAGRPVTKVSMLPTVNADMYWFDIVLDNEKGEWRLTSSVWRQAMLDDFLTD